MKQYKGWEIAKMICEGELKDCRKLIDNQEYTYVVKNNQLRIEEFEGVEGINPIADSSMICSSNRVYKIIPKSVSFEEVLQVDNVKCRIEHEYMNDWMSLRSLEKSKEYLEFNQLMELLSEIPADELKVVLKYGRWYLEN